MEEYKFGASCQNYHTSLQITTENLTGVSCSQDQASGSISPGPCSGKPLRGYRRVLRIPRSAIRRMHGVTNAPPSSVETNPFPAFFTTVSTSPASPVRAGQRQWVFQKSGRFPRFFASAPDRRGPVRLESSNSWEFQNRVTSGSAHPTAPLSRFKPSLRVNFLKEEQS